MYIVYAEVGIKPGRTQESIDNLNANIIPRVKQAPGCVKGTWYGTDETGHCLMFCTSEEQARAMVPMVTAEPGDPIEVAEVEVYQVHAEV